MENGDLDNTFPKNRKTEILNVQLFYIYTKNLGLAMSLQKEAFVEEELYYLIRTILEKNNFEINGVKFSKVEPQHTVNGGIALGALNKAKISPFVVAKA